MTKVEELRDQAIALATYDHKGRVTYEPALEQATSVVDSLIAAAREEGMHSKIDGLQVAWVRAGLNAGRWILLGQPTDWITAEIACDLWHGEQVIRILLPDPDTKEDTREAD